MKIILFKKEKLLKIDADFQELPTSSVVSDIPTKGIVIVQFATRGKSWNENVLANMLIRDYYKNAKTPFYYMPISLEDEYKEEKQQIWEKYNIVKNCTVMVLKDGKELARVDGNVKISQVKKLWSLFLKG